MRDAINQASAGVRKNTTQASLRNQLTILKMNEKGAKNKLDEAIADFFFGAGLISLVIVLKMIGISRGHGYGLAF